MQYIVLGKQVFKVADGFMDEPSDTSYPLYDVHTDEQVGSMEAAYLQKAAVKIPACYIDVYLDGITNCINKTVESIDIRPVLRLLVNNEKYIHGLVGPVLMSDLIVREGGQYFAFENNEQGEPVLYSGETALQLRENIKHGITSCGNGGMKVLHDVYFQDAIYLLLDYHKMNDICVDNTTISEWKAVADTPSIDHNHGIHCKWCMELGLDGTHNNSWANDGNVYDTLVHTTKSNYINSNHTHNP